MNERMYTEKQVSDGLRRWFGQHVPGTLQIANPDRYDYLPGMIMAIRIEAGAAAHDPAFAEETGQLDLYDDDPII